MFKKKSRKCVIDCSLKSSEGCHSLMSIYVTSVGVTFEPRPQPKRISSREETACIMSDPKT